MSKAKTETTNGEESKVVEEKGIAFPSSKKGAKVLKDVNEILNTDFPGRGIYDAIVWKEAVDCRVGTLCSRVKKSLVDGGTFWASKDLSDAHGGIILVYFGKRVGASKDGEFVAYA